MKYSIPVSWLLQRSKYGEMPSAKWAEKFSATSLKTMSLYMTGYEKDSAHFLHAVRL